VRRDRQVEALRAAVLGAPGDTSPEQRRAASLGTDESAAAGYLEKVQQRPHAVTDDDLAALARRGVSDDAVFELTLAAAFGRAAELRRRGRALLRS
jgi:alkylhydroperoxidase family enzyme